MSMRMVPMRASFQKMVRLSRDAAHRSGKQVELALEGEDTEIDRNMVDVIADPLVHMVRNAVDHGIETPAARAAAGKPAVGRLRLAAYHAGGNVVVELRGRRQGTRPRAHRAQGDREGPDRERKGDVGRRHLQAHLRARLLDERGGHRSLRAAASAWTSCAATSSRSRDASRSRRSRDAERSSRSACRSRSPSPTAWRCASAANATSSRSSTSRSASARRRATFRRSRGAARW